MVRLVRLRTSVFFFKHKTDQNGVFFFGWVLQNIFLICGKSFYLTILTFQGVFDFFLRTSGDFLRDSMGLSYGTCSVLLAKVTLLKKHVLEHFYATISSSRCFSFGGLLLVFSLFG